METKETTMNESSGLTEREKIELRKFAYRLAMNIQPIDEYKTRAEWIDFKSREIYDWLLSGRS